MTVWHSGLLHMFTIGLKDVGGMIHSLQSAISYEMCSYLIDV
jgi:hypothetical protein